MIIRMIIISLMVGFVAAGFVWFGIDLFEMARAQRKSKAKPASEETTNEDKAEADQPAKSAE
ncbi:MAG TPA: hypothetical protein PLO37_24140 [Candidatus Hydrogenedentes bacterium]|nr:hypothetical protein [Candidatus Hydrogenedentota bacterium]HPG69954.1 hypothetical protein [Candidatus Hydrogenedentota bacterium]